MIDDFSDAERHGKAAEAVLVLLAERDAGATICPSEVARRLASSADHDAWRAHMGEVHEAVDRLVEAGRVRLSWKGEPMAKRDGAYPPSVKPYAIEAPVSALNPPELGDMSMAAATASGLVGLAA